MGMTMSQKILAAHAGVDKVEPGQLIMANLDMVLGNDITSPVAINEFEKAVKIIEKVKNDTNDKTLKGFLLQQMAEYKYFTDELEAQEF